MEGANQMDPKESKRGEEYEEHKAQNRVRSTSNLGKTAATIAVPLVRGCFYAYGPLLQLPLFNRGNRHGAFIIQKF